MSFPPKTQGLELPRVQRPTGPSCLSRSCQAIHSSHGDSFPAVWKAKLLHQKVANAALSGLLLDFELRASRTRDAPKKDIRQKDLNRRLHRFDVAASRLIS